MRGQQSAELLQAFSLGLQDQGRVSQLYDGTPAAGSSSPDGGSATATAASTDTGGGGDDAGATAAVVVVVVLLLACGVVGAIFFVSQRKTLPHEAAGTPPSSGPGASTRTFHNAAFDASHLASTARGPAAGEGRNRVADNVYEDRTFWQEPGGDDTYAGYEVTSAGAQGGVGVDTYAGYAAPGAAGAPQDATYSGYADPGAAGVPGLSTAALKETVAAAAAYEAPPTVPASLLCLLACPRRLRAPAHATLCALQPPSQTRNGLHTTRQH